jgi:hypothetical protein
MSRVGMKFCLSIERLYDEIGECLEFTTIEYTPSEDGKPSHTYYDLYNENGNLACMDGEEATIIKDDGETLTLLNEESETPVEFKLTLTEFKIAAFC